MSNATSTKPAASLPPEADARALEVQANKIINATKDALLRAQSDAQAAARRFDTLNGVCTSLEAVSEQLATFTFRAADQATASTFSRAAIVALVERLGALAKEAARVSCELRGAIGTRCPSAAPAESRYRASESTQEELLRVVHQLADKATRPTVTRAIYVEIRSSKVPASVSAEAMENLDDDSADWSLGRRRSSGYKN